MNQLAYRIAGAFCCGTALFLLGCTIYFPFFTIMAPPGKVIIGASGLGAAGFFGYSGTKFLTTGGPA